MSTTPATARQQLQQEVAAAMGGGASADDLVGIVIEAGWQPRPLPDPDSEHLEGVLDDGRRIPIEIRHARRGYGADRSPSAASTS